MAAAGASGTDLSMSCRRHLNRMDWPDIGFRIFDCGPITLPHSKLRNPKFLNQ